MTFGFTHVPRQWLRLTWPRDVTVDQATAALRAVNGLSTLRRSEATVLQIVGTTEGIEHYLAVPEPRAEAACRQLRQAITGLGIESVDTPGPLPLDRAWRVWVSTRRRPLASDHAEAVATGLLAALASVEGDEVLILQWLLGPVRRPLAVPVKTPATPGDSWAGSLSRRPSGRRVIWIVKRGGRCSPSRASRAGGPSAGSPCELQG